MGEIWKKNQHKLRTSACAILLYSGNYPDLFLQAEQGFSEVNALVNTDFLMLLTSLCSYPQICK